MVKEPVVGEDGWTLGDDITAEMARACRDICAKRSAPAQVEAEALEMLPTVCRRWHAAALAESGQLSRPLREHLVQQELDSLAAFARTDQDTESL